MFFICYTLAICCFSVTVLLSFFILFVWRFFVFTYGMSFQVTCHVCGSVFSRNRYSRLNYCSSRCRSRKLRVKKSHPDIYVRWMASGLPLSSYLVRYE